MRPPTIPAVPAAPPSATPDLDLINAEHKALMERFEEEAEGDDSGGHRAAVPHVKDGSEGQSAAKKPRTDDDALGESYWRNILRGRIYRVTIQVV